MVFLGFSYISVIQSAVVCVFEHLHHHRKGDRCAMDSGTDSVTDSVATASSVGLCVLGSLWVPGGQTPGKPVENHGKMMGK